MSLKVGTVFWKDDCNSGHYYVVITPVVYPELLVVNFTKQGPRKDQSCVLSPGCHPVVIDESVVAFDYAEVLSTEEVTEKLQNGVFTQKADASEELLLSIWDGAYRTRRMSVRCSGLLSQTIPS